MRAGWNVVLQVGALVVAVLLRFTAPGWLLAVLILTVVGPLLLLVPPVLSLVVLRWRVLPPAVTAPFAAAAGFLLVAALIMPDQADNPPGRIPLLALFGAEGAPDWAWLTGLIAVIGYLGTLAWLGIALILESRRRRTVGAE